MNDKTLVLYYSLSGNTRSVAAALASRLDADLRMIRCPRYRPGPWGYLRAAYDSAKQRAPVIEPLSCELESYGLIILGGPVWAGHIAPPVRTLLQEERARMRSLAFFLTHGGSPAAPVFAEMQRLAGTAPVATLAVLQKQVEQGEYSPAADSFATGLCTRAAA